MPPLASFLTDAGETGNENTVEHYRNWAPDGPAMVIAEAIVAVPTAPLRSIDSLGRGVDEVYCANRREVFSFAVADA